MSERNHKTPATTPICRNLSLTNDSKGTIYVNTRALALTAAALAAPLLLTACGSSTDDAAASKSVTPPPKVETAAGKCETPAPVLVSQVEASLNGSGQTLAHPQSIVGPGDVTYISANIMEGDKRVSPMVVWAAKGGAVYAVSSSGRKTLQVNAGDTYGAAVQDCVLTETRNAGGR